MGVIKKKITKYDKYVVWIEKDEIQANNLEDIADVIIISEKEYDREIQKSKELNAKLESSNLEIQLKDLKIQEKNLEIQKALSQKQEAEEAYKSELSTFEDKYEIESSKLRHQLEVKESEISALKISFEKENKNLQNRLQDDENLKKQIEIYKIGNVGLKNDLKNKEDEIARLKSNYENILEIKSKQEKLIEEKKVELKRLKNIQIEYNKLINNYRHLQEVANKKDENIIELEAKKRKLEHYLLMSAEAINNLKNLGLFNRLLNRIPEDIDELEEDIKKLQPPKEIEIEPVRVNKTSDILGEREIEEEFEN